jgi:outer membrane immunogenic protein
MKKVLALISMLSFPINATAADLYGGSIKDEFVQYAPAFSWTGCYIGANVGTGSQSSETVFAGTPDVPGLFNNGSNTASGVIGGGQLGCDFQRGKFVFGIQGLFDATNLDGRNDYTEGIGLSSTRTQAEWVATLTGRIGIAVTPMTLLYAKGGIAWVSNSYTDSCLTTCSNGTVDNPANPNYVGRGDDRRTGWLVGGGLEHALDERWSVFAEYNYMDFGGETTTITERSDGYTWKNDYDHDIHAVMFGVNLRFN